MDPQYLANLTGPYKPLADNFGHNALSGFEGLPMPGGNAGMAINMFATPWLRQAMGQAGLTPMGMGHDRNAYDVMANQQYTNLRMRAMQEAGQADLQNYMSTLRGGFTAAGMPFGIHQRQFAATLANAVTQATPMLSMMAPELLDQMGGMRGSATVLASRMADAGRYRIDPVTGQMGMSAESTGRMASGLFSTMFSPENIGQMRGFTAGQMGSLYQQLQARGMLGTSMAGRSPGMDPSGALGAAMGGLGGGAMDDKLRSLDTEKIKRSLTGYTQAIAAMRDILGANGNPNAPIPQLVAGLEALTLGSAHQFDPGRLSMLVRQTSNLAKGTGLSLEQATALQAHAAMRADALGLGAGSAIQANQGAMAYGGAFRAMGMGAAPAFGAMTSDQMQQLDANLRLQASASEGANRLGAVMRLGEMSGGFKANTFLGNLSEAVKAGSADFVDPTTGKTRNIATLGQEELVQRAGTAGLGMGQASIRRILGQTQANQEYAEMFNVQRVVRQGQVTDVGNFAKLNIRNTISGQLTEKFVREGMTPAAARKKANAVAASVAENVSSRIMSDEISGEEYANQSSRNSRMSEILEQELKGKVDLGKNSGQFLTNTSEMIHGGLTRAVERGGFGVTTVHDLRKIMSPAALAQAAAIELRATTRGMFQEALTGQTAGSIFQRLITAAQENKGDLPEIIGKALGGVSKSDLSRDLAGPMQAIMDKQKEFEAQEAKVLSIKDPHERAKAMRTLNTLKSGLQESVSKLVRMGEERGLSADGVGADEINRALALNRRTNEGISDYVGIRGLFGAQVTDAEKSALLAKQDKAATAEEAHAVIIARRQIEAGKDVTADEVAAYRTKHKAGDMSDAQIRSQIKATREAFVGAITNDDVAREMKNLNLGGTPDERSAIAKQAILIQRRMTPPRATADEVKKVQTEFAGLDADTAAELANNRLRVKRLGVGDEVRAKMGGKIGFEAETAAIEAVFQEKIAAAQVVSSDDRQAWKTAHPEDATLDNAELDKKVLGDRSKLSKQLYGSFFGSRTGAEFRQGAAATSAETENIAYRLVASKQTFGRLGSQAAVVSEKLMKGEQRMRELALIYSGGDQGRLLLGDIHASPDQAKKVMEEVSQITKYREDTFKDLNEQLGKKGRQFTGSNEDEAKRLLTMTGGDVSDKNVKALAEKVGHARKLSDYQASRVSSIFGKTEKSRSPEEQKELDNIAKESGLTRKELEATAEVEGKLHQVQEQALKGFHVNAKDLAGELFKSFGFDKATDADLAKVSGQLGSVTGMQMAKRIIESQAHLKARAQQFDPSKTGNAGIDNMTGEFFRISKIESAAEREKAMRGFQEKVGIEFGKSGEMTGAGAAEWKRLTQDIQFQDRSRFSEVGPDGEKRGFKGVGDIQKLIERTIRGGGELEKGANPDGTPGGSQNIKVTGTVTLVNRDQAEINFDGASTGDWGGG